MGRAHASGEQPEGPGRRCPFQRSPGEEDREDLMLAGGGGLSQGARVLSPFLLPGPLGLPKVTPSP